LTQRPQDFVVCGQKERLDPHGKDIEWRHSPSSDGFLLALPFMLLLLVLLLLVEADGSAAVV
jgi:hypothetical protein